MNSPVREKLDASHVEDMDKPCGKQNALDAENLPSYDDDETRMVRRKIDWRLIPMLTLLYLLAFLDRGNIGNAKVAGMNNDLGLTPTQYNLALTVFFIPYALFEVPSNVVLKLMRPCRWIAFLVISWGAVMTCQGLVRNFGGLVTTRVLLGVFEAGFLPASTYLLGEWYCRFELQWRLSMFFSAASMAGAFSGLLSFAGVGGLEGWRWIFILEGIVTVVVGANFIKTRLENDSGTSSGRVQTSESELFKWAYLNSVLLDWRIWFTIFNIWGNTIPVYGFTFTAPTIIHELGYSAEQAQLLTIPIYAVGLVATLLVSWLADRYHRRWIFIMIPYTVALIAGVYPPAITLFAWLSNNLSPTWKRRATGMALSIMLGNIGGAIGSNIYLARESPVGAYASANRKRDEMSEDEIRAKYTEQELLDLGDRSPLYRYVL
ncbi:unnamed protein product [Clonostachys solani]|uniref:Major facilitator superfamily (MFS) profile domain-containing protein n=1 Tax=Clonostachys solani TaxID=160281 RepID=A0A9N9ZMY2_9HYPO|nr:unnamed protein product [Clonostachys solani]